MRGPEHETDRFRRERRQRHGHQQKQETGRVQPVLFSASEGLLCRVAQIVQQRRRSLGVRGCDLHIGSLRKADSRLRAVSPSSKKRARGGLVALALSLPPAFVSAQLTTDQVPLQRTVPAEVEVQAELERSRLRLGPVRVLPWFAVPNFGYNNNIFGSSENPVGDWLATVGAGARFYLPIGSKTFFRLDALPQYTWYKDLSVRDQWGGRGEAAYLAFFNRLSFQLSGSLYREPYRRSHLGGPRPGRRDLMGWKGQCRSRRHPARFRSLRVPRFCKHGSRIPASC